MARPRLWVSVVAVTAALVVAGCYGSTDPATNITFDSAKLNAHGTANNGDAEAWFELWATGSSDPHLELGRHTWPAGASGPLSFTASLTPNKSYSFRICGKDVGGDPACAQTRTFTTLDGDTASGTFASGSSSASFSAWSGPHGERMTGTQFSCIGGTCKRFDLDCLKVSGNRAIIGMGQTLYLIEDGNPDTLANPRPDTSPQCATATAADFVVNPSYTVDATVHDAP